MAIDHFFCAIIIIAISYNYKNSSDCEDAMTALDLYSTSFTNRPRTSVTEIYGGGATTLSARNAFHACHSLFLSNKINIQFTVFIIIDIVKLQQDNHCEKCHYKVQSNQSIKTRHMHRECSYDLGLSFLPEYRAHSDTLATFTTLKRTPA